MRTNVCTHRRVHTPEIYVRRWRSNVKSNRPQSAMDIVAHAHRRSHEFRVQLEWTPIRQGVVGYVVGVLWCNIETQLG